MITINRIKEIRLTKGISCYRLAKMIGCTPAHLFGVERNKWGVSDEIARRLSVALDTNIENIFTVASSDESKKVLTSL